MMPPSRTDVPIIGGGCRWHVAGLVPQLRAARRRSETPAHIGAHRLRVPTQARLAAEPEPKGMGLMACLRACLWACLRARVQA